MSGVWCSRPSHRVDQMGKEAVSVISFSPAKTTAECVGDTQQSFQLYPHVDDNQKLR
jgi:hypothetical protein